MRGRLGSLILWAALAVSTSSDAVAFGRRRSLDYDGGDYGSAWGGGGGYGSRAYWQDWQSVGPRRGWGGSENPCGDTRTQESFGFTSKTVPHEVVNVEHVYHHQNRLHHVTHEVNHDVYIKNVKVHHNVTHDQTIHHRRENTRYIEQNVEQCVNEREVLPSRWENDCAPYRGR